MESLGLYTLLVWFGMVLCARMTKGTLTAASVKSEETCAMMTRKPLYDPEQVMLKWRVYYSFGTKLKNCTYAHIMPVSEQTQTHYARRYTYRMAEEIDWYSSELRILFGTGEELLMFADGGARGRFLAMETTNGYGYARNMPISLVKYAIKAYHFFRYLIVLNCEDFRGYLMAKPDDTKVSIKEITGLVDTVLPGKKGYFACLPN